MRAAVLVAIAAVLTGGAGGAAGADPPERLTFYPQAGILWQDLYINNYVDVDPGSGILDFACGSQTYNGHTGQDSDIRSFREMDIGVPVYAVLDGTVVSRQDGFFDREYGPPKARFDNNLVIEHGPGRFTIYGHLRRGIELRRGSAVVAGQQIGWTASSGKSTWPHLHFTYTVDGDVVEPFAGPCRPGQSEWADQPSAPLEPYARDLAVSARPFRGRALLPYDQAVRTGTFVRGIRTINVRLDIGAAWDAGRVRVRILRPDGSEVVSDSRTMHPAHGQWSRYYALRVDLDEIGRWRLTADIDETRVADAPLTVVATAAEVRNRPPNAVSLELLPDEPKAGDILQCRVKTSLVTEDPDFDIVRYRYRWTVDGRAVRSVTSAALSDVLRRGLAPAGSRVGCSVAVSDGRLSWPSRRAAGTIRR